MDNGEIEGAADDGNPVPAPPNGRRYLPVGSSDRAVIQMTSMEPGFSSSTAAAAAAVGGITPQPTRKLDPSMAGVWQSLVLVSFCGACTFLTGTSLSAIATNGAMKGGGPYYLIGHVLGPDVGVNIGLCFFLGNAVAGSMFLTATVAWPAPAVTYIGIILSTLGAALQRLTVAPRLLAAIANDDILPVLNYLKVSEGAEPHSATLFTAFICICCVVIGNLDLITPTITMFFLLCYAGVNLSRFLLDLLDAPSWRPHWKFHHWSLSLVGALLCVVIMFFISWSFTVVSLALASLIYYYVSLKGKAGDWGDGFKSAYFQLALRSLRSLGENVPCHPKLADFANCMKKKGRGMSIFASIIDSDYHELAEDAKTACRQLDTYIEYKRCEGVAEIIVAPSMSEGFRSIVQTMGLGNLKPNIIVMWYPEIWRRENLIQIPSTFWPNEYQRQYGTIDLYWIVRDGGLMLLLSQLLLTKETFESCKIQVFCIAEEDTDAEELKADVIVVTMKSWEPHMESSSSGAPQDDSQEAYTSAQRRIST
uniref:Amino acid permease/ SLC12A domain-containing protein n=1 Tax=Oryza punctata TaxID=4537 RepID=A0A0E0M553_ORYPU